MQKLNCQLIPLISMVLQSVLCESGGSEKILEWGGKRKGEDIFHYSGWENQNFY